MLVELHSSESPDALVYFNRAQEADESGWREWRSGRMPRRKIKISQEMPTGRNYFGEQILK